LESWNFSMSDADYKAIVKEVLENQQKLSPDYSRILKKSIRGNITVKGYRDSSRAHTSSLIQKIEKASSWNNPFPFILEAWLALHDDLEKKVSRFLNSFSLPETETLADQDENTAKIWSEEVFNKAIEEFWEQHPNFERKKAEIMLGLLKYYAEETVLDKPIEKKEPETILKRIFEELQDVPANSPEWEHQKFDAFIKDIEKLRQRKCQEREVPREKLQLALARLIKEEKALSFFNYFSDVSSWTAEMCSLSEAAGLEEKVQNLCNLIVEYQQLISNQPTPTSYVESKNQSAEREKKEHQIADIYNHLQRLFTPPRNEPLVAEPEHSLPEKNEEQSFISQPTFSSSSESGTEETQTDFSESETKKEVPEEEDISKRSLSEPESDKNSLLAHNSNDNFVSVKKTQEPPQKLLPAKEVAESLEKNDDEELWNNLLWSFIAEDDLPAAYWLIRSLNASSEFTSPMPDYILAAVQGSRWLSPDNGLFVQDMLSITEKSEDPSEYTEMLMLASSLYSSVVAPFSGMISWLNVPSCCPELNSLVVSVREFAGHNISFHPEDLEGITKEEQREAEIEDIARKAAQWLRGSKKQKIAYKPAYDVWRILVGEKGELEELLIPVSEDCRDHIKEVKYKLDQYWEGGHLISERISNTHKNYRKNTKRQLKPIEGRVYNHLVNRIKDALGLARLWCNQVERLHEIQQRDSKWRFDQVERLRDTVQESLPKVKLALEELSQKEAPQAATAMCLSRTIKQLAETLNLETSYENQLRVNDYEWFTNGAEKLHDALSRRLLWLPELSFSDDGQPTEETGIANLLRVACIEGRSLSNSFEGWLEKQDYRFVTKIMDCIKEELDIPENLNHYREKLAGSKETLQKRIQEINEAIEQALVDGIIGEEERSKHSTDTVTIKPEETKNFPLEFEKLDKVETDLSRARTERRDELHEEWEEIKKQLSGSHIKPAEKKQISDSISKDLKNEDTRVVEETLSSLSRVLDGTASLDEILPSLKKEEVDVLDEFTKKAPGIKDWLGNKNVKFIIPNINKGLKTSIDGISFAGISKPRRDEAVKAIEEWHQLKQKRPRNLKSLRPLKVLLEYLGFEDAKLHTEKKGEDWLYADVNMSANDSLVRPIPQFGSQAYGHYHVICLWERPGAESIAARLRELRLDMGTVIVFYLGRIPQGQKRDIARICREQELALAILDEILLIFLALERDSRLPAFLNCALPLAALNPYTPFKAGDVPPEMFFGRRRMVGDLQDPSGSCIVYGGRQLGKSALLRHVKRQFHNPERRKFAWIEDMKLIFDPDPGKYKNLFWRKLQDGFIQEELLSSKKKATKDKTIIEHIRQIMKDDQIRVLVMFDEADDFLRADAGKNFEVVDELRKLMAETERRFKVVFAGLHNVQRFQGIPNQPLAHFGDPLCVGPLEAKDAHQLINQPLRTLGYRFNNTTVLRILSYTNSHPGLIQIFCQELLRRLNKRTGNLLPPNRIEKDDIEAVYRLPKVRKSIKDRFDWTLALDPHYQAIAWAMIYDQIEKGGSYSSAYTSSSILELVRYWWEKGFGQKDSNEMQSLLDEVSGLGVLVRNVEGKYYLRSPNLVRLMGTIEDIEDQLLNLPLKELPRPFEAHNFHALVNPDRRNYSPLSNAEERNLMVQRFGVGLVCASEAMGFSMLSEVFKKHADFDEGLHTDVPADIIDGDKLSRWLKNYIEINKSHKCLVVCYRPPQNTLGNLRDLVESALDFCRLHSRRESQWLRILFLFDSSATIAWLSLSHIERKQLEKDMDAIVSPRHWNLDGINHRLRQNEKINTEDIIGKAVLRETGGWPILLDRLFDLCGEDGDVKPAIENLKKELEASDSDMCKKFRKSLGLEVNELVYRIWEIVFQDPGSVPVDLIRDMIDPELEPENYNNAIEYLHRMGCIIMCDNNEIGIQPSLKRLLLPL